MNERTTATSRLHQDLAPRIVPVVLANLTTRYPYHDAHLTQRPEPPHDPFLAHPAFGNSFDWHSSVHSHWTAVQLIDYYDARPNRRPVELERLELVVYEHLAAERIATERAYLLEHRSYERPYGWAWAMMLAAAARRASYAAIRECAPQLYDLAEYIAAEAVRWLNVLPFPVRHGVHSNTAFALGLTLDAASELGFVELASTIRDRARTWFGNDRRWPGEFERGGHDFLSPGLTEADLMRRVLDPNEFAAWWNQFLPALSPESTILSVAPVPDVEDGHVVHLHGLNLSRAASLARIAQALRAPALLEHANRLYRASVDRSARGTYVETHWLPTFAWDAAVSIDAAESSW